LFDYISKKSCDDDKSSKGNDTEDNELHNLDKKNREGNVIQYSQDLVKKINKLARNRHEYGGICHEYWGTYALIEAELLDESLNTPNDLQTLKFDQAMMIP
jgi:hypothetical protein